MSIHRQQTKSAAINFSSSGDNTIVAASGGSPITIYGLFFTVSGATDITYKDSAVGGLSGAIIFTGNGSSQTLPLSDEPYMSLKPASDFVMNSSNAVTVGGIVWYTTG